MENLTRDDFRQLFFIDKEIKRLQLEIEDIETRGTHCTQNYESMDMPRGSGVGDKVGETSVEAESVEEVIRYALRKREREKAKLLMRIEQEPDAETRLILRYRYAEKMSWDDVAAMINSTYDAVKAKDKRFFAKMKK